jgi:hypothetical protein
MPRKGPAPRRPLVADPVYQSPLVTQLVNKVLVDGKRSVAEAIVYGALVHLTDLVIDSGVEKDALGRGGLARINVGHDPDIANLGQVSFDIDSHMNLSELSASQRPIAR